MMNCQAWAEAEFGPVDVGDRRRTRRLVQVAAALAQKPNGTLPASFDSLKEVRAAYRLLECEEVSHERILASHCARIRQACRSPGLYLHIEDTVQLDYTTHGGTEGLGPIGDGNGRGLLVHHRLALEVVGWDEEERPQARILGLSHQECWTRPEQPRRGPAQRREAKAARLSRERESQRWARALEGEGFLPAHARWVQVSDRESDIYEVLERNLAIHGDFVLRANQPRALAEEGGSVFSAVAQAPVRTRYPLALRARPGQSARVALLAVRTVRVTLRGPWRPGGWRSPIAVNVVEVQEEDPPPGVEPVHWVLLTSLPIDTLQEVRQVIGIYTCRWVVEEFHKALQSGTKVEESQLTEGRKLKALVGVLSLVALRLVDTKLQARAQPDAPVPPEQFGPEVLAMLTAKFGQPKEGWTQRLVWRSIARLGGFLGRKCDGEPGWQTIWRGWQRLRTLVEGAELTP